MFIFVTTCFNCEKFIENCINSVLFQTYEEWQMYIIDDASDDESVKVAKRTAGHDQRIHIIENESNVGAVYNKTVNFVNHAAPKDEDVIITLDGDDYLAHEKVLSYLETVYKKDIWMTYGGFKMNVLYNKEFYGQIDWGKSLRSQPFCLTHLRSHKFFLLKNIKDKDLCNRLGQLFRYPEDVILFIPMAEMSGKKHTHFSQETNYFYNVNSNSDERVSARKDHINGIITEDLSFRNPYKIKTKRQLVDNTCDWRLYKTIR